MKKSIVSGMAALLIAGVLAGCGNKSASTSSSSQSSSSQSSQVTSSQSASAMSNSSMPVQHVDDKTVGVMVALLAQPDWFKGSIDDMYYGVHGQDGDDDSGDLNGYSYITTNGDPTSFLHYKVNGNMVTYKQWIPGDSVADGHMETKTVSLARLEKDYYVSQSQKDEVNGYANQLQSEAAYNSSIKNTENNDDDDDD